MNGLKNLGLIKNVFPILLSPEENCKKKFTQYSSYQKHLRIHRGEKPYICDEENCRHSFTQVCFFLKKYDCVFKIFWILLVFC